MDVKIKTMDYGNKTNESFLPDGTVPIGDFQ